MWDLGAQGGNAKALARSNAPGGSTALVTRAWRKHALLIVVLQEKIESV